MINVDELIKNALKNKQTLELKAYRNLKAKQLEYSTAKNAKPLDEAAQFQLIGKMCKDLMNSEITYAEAHREDLMNEVKDERLVLQKLLPEPVKAEKIKYALENEILPESKQITKKEMGKTIKALKEKFPTADGKVIANIVSEYIV